MILLKYLAYQKLDCIKFSKFLKNQQTIETGQTQNIFVRNNSTLFYIIKPNLNVIWYKF